MYKTCSRCGKTLPATSEFFYRNNRLKDGLQGHCKECHREAQRRYKRNRWATDPEHRINSKCRQALWKAIRTYAESVRKHKSYKDHLLGYWRWYKLLGYSFWTLIIRFEDLFEPGMGWHNYGKWEVDHMKPVASFHFSSTDDPAFHECWALENLRPLWKEENRNRSRI